MERHFSLNESDHLAQLVRQRFAADQISGDLQQQLEQTMRQARLFDARDFERFSLEEIFVYLKASHQYYLNNCIPKLENTLWQMHAKMGAEYWSVKLLMLFLTAYRKELVEHIEHEEEVLFSFVERLLSHNYSEQHKELALNHFIHAHNDNVVIQLDALKNDVLTFDADLKDNLILDVLFNQLRTFQHDLLVHGLIEDQVFIPKIKEYLKNG